MGGVAILALLIFAVVSAGDEEEQANGNGDGDGDGDGGMTDEEYLFRVQDLIKFEPQQGAFYAIQGGGATAEEIAGILLGPYDNGANRIRLIKCISESEWNSLLYMSARTAGSWGTAYDVRGRQLSAAWLPRHNSAAQAMANRQMPTRNIHPNGDSMGGGGYFGTIWIPRFTAGNDFVSCSDDRDPPGWLMAILNPPGMSVLPLPPSAGAGV